MTAAPSYPTTRTAPASAPPPRLRRLYLARFVFALAWAALFVSTSSPYGTAALALAVLYPVVDIVAAGIDVRSTAAAGRSRVALYLNIGVSAVAAVALAVIGAGEERDVLVVWGAWAIAAGAVQLAVGLQRRAQVGQLPMILSGALSIVAGTFFVASAGSATSLGSIAGYAVVGGAFFLVSALRQGRREGERATSGA